MTDPSLTLLLLVSNIALIIREQCYLLHADKCDPIFKNQHNGA